VAKAAPAGVDGVFVKGGNTGVCSVAEDVDMGQRVIHIQGGFETFLDGGESMASTGVLKKLENELFRVSGTPTWEIPRNLGSFVHSLSAFKTLFLFRVAY